MEKPIPHCKLPVVKGFVAAGKVRATQSARIGATALGLELADMLAVAMALTPADFYKSMTTHADHPKRGKPLRSGRGQERVQRSCT